MTELCKNCQNLMTWELSDEDKKRMQLKENIITYCGANVSDRRKCIFNTEATK